MAEEIEIGYPNIKQSWGIAGISILSMIVFVPVLALLKTMAGDELSFLLYYVLSMSAAFWFAHSKRKKWTRADGYNLDIGSAKIMLLISIAVIAIQVGIIAPLVDLVPMPDVIKKMFVEFAKRRSVFSFIAIVIAAPILEELIFRGIILDGLLKKYSPLRAIAISSLLFGLVHLNPWQFIAALAIGFFSGWVYYETKKLTLSITIHFVNNLFAFCSMYFMDAEAAMDRPLTEWYGGIFNTLGITFGALVVAAICLYFLRLEFKNTGTRQNSLNLDTSDEKIVEE